MDTRKLEPTDWQTCFDGASRHLRASRVEIEVSGLDVGNQVVTSRIAIDGLATGISNSCC